MDREVPMAVAVSGHREGATVPSSMAVTQAATQGAAEVLARLGTRTKGLPADEAARRLRVVGPNAVRSYRARAWPVLRSRLRDMAGWPPAHGGRDRAGAR